LGGYDYETTYGSFEEMNHSMAETISSYFILTPWGAFSDAELAQWYDQAGPDLQRPSPPQLRDALPQGTKGQEDCQDQVRIGVLQRVREALLDKHAGLQVPKLRESSVKPRLTSRP